MGFFPINNSRFGASKPICEFKFNASVQIRKTITQFFQGLTSVTSYFPKSTWFDAYTFKKIESKGENITVNAPLDRIPLFFKDGNIVPYQEPAQTTTEA